MINVYVDLGGSNLRYGESTKTIDVIDAAIKEVSISAIDKSPTTESTSFDDFTIIDSTVPSYVGRRFVRGSSMGYFQGNILRCDSTDPKCMQDITYINALYSIVKILAKKSIYSEPEVGVNAVIPVGEFYETNPDYAEIFKDGLEGTHRIQFNKKGVVVDIAILRENILITGEGAVVAMSYCDETAISSGVTIIPDAGYRSTDITLMIGLDIVGQKARSIPMGGFNVEAMLVNKLEKNGYPSSGIAVKSAIETGTIEKNSETIEVHSIVKEVKTEFARAIAKGISSVMSSEFMTVYDINNIVFVGRPYSNPANEAMGDLKDLLVEALGITVNTFVPDDLELANIKALINACED